MERRNSGRFRRGVFGVTSPARKIGLTEGACLAKPRIDRNSQAHQDFEWLARKAGMDPASLWVGGYADYEWDHLRKLLHAYGIAVEGRDVLEFGCNVGGSSVVLAALGGTVTAIDVNSDTALIAQANLDRHGLGGRARVSHVPDTRTLSFASASFDLVVANSVLEYVEPGHLDGVLAELYRVLRNGGILFICGTASRTALREVHSRRWFVNFLPRRLDRLIGRHLQRGLSPLFLAKCLEPRFATRAHSRWLEARRAVHGEPSLPMHAAGRIAALLGCAPGWLTPNIELVLQKENPAG